MRNIKKLHDLYMWQEQGVWNWTSWVTLICQIAHVRIKVKWQIIIWSLLGQIVEEILRSLMIYLARGSSGILRCVTLFCGYQSAHSTYSQAKWQIKYQIKDTKIVKKTLRSLVIYLAGVGTGRKLGFLRDATSSIHVTVRFPLIQMRIET